MPVAIGYHKDPVTAALMKICGIKPSDGRRVVDFVIECKADSPITVYVKEYLPSRSIEEIEKLAVDTASQFNEVYWTKQPVIIKEVADFKVNPDCTVETLPLAEEVGK